jgi:hypothetical protein
MSEQLLNLVMTLTTGLGVPGLFVVFWIWERKRTQLVVDRHLDEQKKLYADWLKEQRDLYERYLEDMREWASPRDRSRLRYTPDLQHPTGPGEMRPFASREANQISAGD